MKSVLLKTAVRLILPLLLLFSLYLLLRGHDEPGGGFIGGVTAASALALHALAFGSGRTRRLLRVSPLNLLVAGLSLGALSGIPSLVSGKGYLKGIWSGLKVPSIGTFGTPLMFETGIYLLVTGGVLLIFFSLKERLP